MEPQSQLNAQIQNDPILNVVAQSIVNSFDHLYTNLDKMKQKATDEKQIQQLSHMQDKIDHLATKTLIQSQDLRSPMKRTNVQWEIQNLKQQLMLMQKRHNQLQEKHIQLQKRVASIQCTMVSKQQFNQLKSKCEQRFSLFDNRFKVIQQQNKKLFVYVDEQFKKRIKPSQQFQQKLNELMTTNYRMFEYAKKMYWSLINQILAYRALTTGMIQKAESKKSNNSQNTILNSIFNQLLNIVSSATYLIAGIPFAGGIFLVVKDLSSVFFSKQEDVMTHNIRLRIQGYYTEGQIAEDVAKAVLTLIQKPSIEARLSQFKTKTMIMKALTKFFQFIAITQFTPESLANIFFGKLSRIKKQKQSQQSDYLSQNVATDTSLILWKIAESKSANKRQPVTEAVKNLFNKKSENLQAQMNILNIQQNVAVNKGDNPILQRNFILDNQDDQINPNQQMQNKILNQKNKKMNQSQLSTRASDSNLAQKKFKDFNNQPTLQSNVKTTYTNSNFKRNDQNYRRQNYFKLKIVKAEFNLKKQFFKMSPYCVIKYKQKIVFTTCQKAADTKPTWNQQFIFESSQIPSTITFEIYDKQKVFKDNLIGIANIIDSQYNKREQQVQLWNEGKPIGKLYITLQP